MLWKGYVFKDLPPILFKQNFAIIKSTFWENSVLLETYFLE